MTIDEAAVTPPTSVNVQPDPIALIRGCTTATPAALRRLRPMFSDAITDAGFPE